MHIEDPEVLAEALRVHLKTQIVVRYAVQTQGESRYDAELVVMENGPNPSFLAHMVIAVYVDHRVEVETRFTVTSLRDKPSALTELCGKWEYKRFDDWLHGSPFMGAHAIYDHGQLYTSIKMDADDHRWRFLTGLILGELRKLSDLHADEGDGALGVELMLKRFSAFAGQIEGRWMDRVLNT